MFVRWAGILAYSAKRPGITKLRQALDLLITSQYLKLTIMTAMEPFLCFLVAFYLAKQTNRPYSYSQYWTGTSLQWRLMMGNLF